MNDIKNLLTNQDIPFIVRFIVGFGLVSLGFLAIWYGILYFIFIVALFLGIALGTVGLIFLAGLAPVLTILSIFGLVSLKTVLLSWSALVMVSGYFYYKMWRKTKKMEEDELEILGKCVY